MKYLERYVTIKVYVRHQNNLEVRIW